MERLEVKKRELKGRKTDHLREEGVVPAVVYGPEIDSQSLKVEEKEFLDVFGKAGEASMIELEVGKRKHTVLVKDYHLDPLTEEVVHIDFYQPILTEEIEANVPLVFEGEAPAVKEKEGILIKNMEEIPVSALPEDLPSRIKVDIAGLEALEDTVEVGDLKVPEEVRVLRNEKDIVASVSAPKTAEELMEEMEEKEEEELFVGEEVSLEEEEEAEEVPEGEEAEREEEKEEGKGEQEGIEL